MLPSGYHGIKVVANFDELISTPFNNGINALCWQRNLQGDFNEVVESLGPGIDILTITDELLLKLNLSEGGSKAREVLLEDQKLLREFDLSPTLECVYEGRRDKSGGPIATDVFSFHADSADAMADTYLCSYTEAASEGMRNDQARRCVDVPEIRGKLLRQFGGKDDEEFEEYLSAHSYDLHYLPLPNAQPFSFGLGNLWRIAIEYPGCPVPPCIHRAPTTMAGQGPRLLLIS